MRAAPRFPGELPAGATLACDVPGYRKVRAPFRQLLENRCRGNPPTEGSNPSPSAGRPESLVGTGFRDELPEQGDAPATGVLPTRLRAV
jgi:hypothetical protein